jgi:energy-coupling factor transporter ATP-binding protein EcfA2
VSAPLLAAQGLGLRRGDREILADIDLTLRPGERWLLWGGNGAGKTSLARLLAGLQGPDTGRVLRSPGLETPLPLLFQDPDAQLAAATVRDEIALGARGPGEPFVTTEGEGPAGKRIAAALTSFRLADLARRNPHSLSGGEKRRLGLAALSVLDSPLLILDEPELHLDEPSWRELCDHLDAWLAAAPTERALLEITRRPERLPGADGLLVLHEGRLLAAGEPRRTYQALVGRGLPLPRVPEWEEASPAPVTSASASVDAAPLLKARGLGLKRPDGRPLLVDLDLEIGEGERLLLLGDNGSGKSSLLLLLADLADPDAGTLERREGLETGLAFQDPERVCFAETVREELAFGLRRRGLSEESIEARVTLALELFGLDPERFAARDPFTLSAGEQRRLALACVAAPGPELLILDEAAAALDEQGREQLREALESWTGAVIWADCRPPAGFEGFWHRSLHLDGGGLKEMGSRKVPRP